MSILRFEKVATPFTAATVAVPESVPADGFVPIAMVTELAAVVTVFPWASMVTCTAGVMDAPAATFEGWTLNASFAAVPLVTLKAVLVALVRPAALTVKV